MPAHDRPTDLGVAAETATRHVVGTYHAGALRWDRCLRDTMVMYAKGSRKVHVSRDRDGMPWPVSAVVGRTAAPLREQAAAALRNAILSMAIPEGARLVERELIERLAVSRTTVREALRELESEGLVEVIPQRGAVVATTSPQDAADLYAARVAIEELIVQRFIERADDATAKELKDAVDAYAKVATDDHPVTEMLAAKDEFYAVLGKGAQSPVLWQLLTGLQARVRVLRARSLSQPGRPAESAKELQDLVAAILKRDTKAATRLCAQHVRSAAATGLPALTKAREQDNPPTPKTKRATGRQTVPA